jgi:hypothetical protein
MPSLYENDTELQQTVKNGLSCKKWAHDTKWLAT